MNRSPTNRPATGYRRRSIAWLLLLAWTASGLGCGAGPGANETPTPSATPAPTDTPTLMPDPTTPPDPLPTPTLEPLSPGARAWTIDDPEDLLSGQAAQGRIGDVMMANEHIRVVVQAPGRDIGWGMFGGTLIDAAVVNPDGSFSQDAFGELSVFFNLGLSANATFVEIVDDGTASRTAIVVAEGEDDLFDVLKVDAALDEYASALPYDVNADFPLRIRTTYSLGPDDRHVHIVTEFVNEGDRDIATPVGDLIASGGDVEVFVPNPALNSFEVTLEGNDYEFTWGGFGEAEFAIADFIGQFGDGVSYGYVPPTDRFGDPDSFVATISGVSVVVLGTTNIAEVLLGSRQALLEIPADGSASIARDLVVGRDLGAVTDEVYRLRGEYTGSVHGQVTEAGTGAPLPGVRVAVVADAHPEAAVTEFYTDSRGLFEGTLPPGDYGLMALEGFDFLQDGRPAILEPVPFSVVANQSTRRDLELGETGEVSIEVLDGNLGDGSRLPAKATFYGAYDTPPSSLVDTSSDSLGGGVSRIVWLPDGQGNFDVKPGIYRVVVTRGFEYDLVEFAEVEVVSGTPVNLSATLTRVVDTSGFISGDLHVHSINSPDSTVALGDRVTTFLGEGVEVLVATDHDVVTDYRPVIDDMDAGTWITSMPGSETTPFNMGHFNIFPQQHDPMSRTGGALDWADADYRPNDIATGEPVDLEIPPDLSNAEDNLTASQIFKAIELASSGTQVRQVNHARGYLGGYFTQIGLDLTKLGTAKECAADPAEFRIEPHADLFVPEWISAMEIQNGTGIDGAIELMNDWFGLLNLGVVLAGTAVSDTHREVGSVAGYARTFVQVDNDDVAAAHNDLEFPERFATSLNGLHATGGTGLFVTLQAEGRDGARAAMGETLSVSDGEIVLHIRIQAPPWASFHTLNVFSNTVVRANTRTMDFDLPEELGPVMTRTTDGDFDIEAVPVESSAETDVFRWESNLEIPMTLEQDAWILVTVHGSSDGLRPGINKGSRPFAFTNPVFVDADGDGIYVPPGPDFVVPADQ